MRSAILERNQVLKSKTSRVIMEKVQAESLTESLMAGRDYSCFLFQ